MKTKSGTLLLLLLALWVASVVGREGTWNGRIVMPTQDKNDNEPEKGTRWAILIAGSAGYWNYRHQSDVCHAYQILKRGGLKDENIIVFMYDDIAYDSENPHPGTLINRPGGPDVYEGVPKDYTGSNVTVNNFLAAILGDKDAITGGSGKVVASGPNDHVFIYYSDHGGPGVLGMPTSPYLYADEFVETLKKKAELGAFKELVIYLEACESGSIFDGLLPEGLNIYVTTASNAEESSWGTYCPGMFPEPPPEYETCLGDLYSVAWMEDTEKQNLRKETLEDQYILVKSRTSNDETYNSGSHVMQYGDLRIDVEELECFLGFDPANENVTKPALPELLSQNTYKHLTHVPQRAADILHLMYKYDRATEGSSRKLHAGLELANTQAYRKYLNSKVLAIGMSLFGDEKGPWELAAVCFVGQVLVDDWTCLRTMVRIFEKNCGALTQYGMKHMRAFANICNAGFSTIDMAIASDKACALGSGLWTPLTSGFSA